MSQKTLNLCLERYNFVKFGETTKSSHTVLCINNAYSVNSDKYRLTPAAIASKHGDGYVFTLNYDFDRPLFTIVQKSYALDGTSGNIVFEGIDPISKGGSKYLRKVTVSPVKLSDGSFLLEVTGDEYLRIGTTGAALGDEELESLNEKIVATGGIGKSVETVGGKQVLKLDAGGPSGAKEIVYFEIDPSNPPSGIYDDITVALSNDKEPVIRIDGAVYFYTSTGTDKYVFVGDYTKDAVGYTEIEVSDDDSVASKSVNDKVFNLYILPQDDPASPGEAPGSEEQWVCDANKHVVTKDELIAAHADCRYFILNNDVDPDSNSRKYFAAVTNISNSYVQLRFYMVEYSGEGAADFYQKTVSNDSEGRLYISDSYQTYLAGTSQAVLVSEPQSFNATQKAQGRDNIGAASASDVTALQSQVSSLSDVSAYSVKGEATVAQLNAGPSGIQAGWAYQLTDSGTLTDGTLAVVAGDTVAWDGTKWFPLVRSDYYATKIYSQNVAHSIAPEFIPSSKPNPTTTIAGNPYIYEGSLYLAKEAYQGPWNASKFIKIPLSYIINRLITSFAPNFDPSRTGEGDDLYKAGERVMYYGKLYRFKNDHYGPWDDEDVTTVQIDSEFADEATFKVVQEALKVAFANCQSIQAMTPLTYYLATSGGVVIWDHELQHKGCAISVSPGDKIVVSNSITRLAFLKSLAGFDSYGTTADMSSATGYTGLISLSGGSGEYVVPSDVNYLYFTTILNGVPYVPTIAINGVSLNGGIISDLAKKVQKGYFANIFNYFVNNTINPPMTMLWSPDYNTATDLQRFMNADLSDQGGDYLGLVQQSDDGVSFVAPTGYTWGTSIKAIWPHITKTYFRILLKRNDGGVLENSDVWLIDVEGSTSKEITNIKYDLGQGRTNWSGKKWVAFGCSLSDSGPNGNANTIPPTGLYPKYLTALSGLKHKNWAYGGSSFTYNDGTHPTYLERATAAVAAGDIADADIVTVDGCVNDYAHGSPIGQRTDTGTTTVCGAIYNFIATIRAANNKCTIVLIGDSTGKDYGGRSDCNFDQTKTVVDGGETHYYTQSDYIAALKMMADYIGVKFINAGAISGINKYTPDYIIDVVHHTEEGGKRFANAIWSELHAMQP